MTRQTIGESLAVRLYAAETAIDRAMAETAALTAALPAARAEAYLSLARKLGLEALAAGPVDKPGDTPPIGGGVCPEGDTVPTW